MEKFDAHKKHTSENTQNECDDYIAPHTEEVSRLDAEIHALEDEISKYAKGDILNKATHILE